VNAITGVVIAVSTRTVDDNVAKAKTTAAIGSEMPAKLPGNSRGVIGNALGSKTPTEIYVFITI
jgi:hypothetical protein